jgi:hypothetical protein
MLRTCTWAHEADPLAIRSGRLSMHRTRPTRLRYAAGGALRLETRPEWAEQRPEWAEKRPKWAETRPEWAEKRPQEGSERKEK